MLKTTLVFLSLLFFSSLSQAEPLNSQTNQAQEKINTVSQRLASKNINEILEITMKLQLDCQRALDQDTCSGVKTMLAVLDLRIDELPSELTAKSAAFLQGIISGIKQANKTSFAQLSESF